MATASLLLPLRLLAWNAGAAARVAGRPRPVNTAPTFARPVAAGERQLPLGPRLYSLAAGEGQAVSPGDNPGSAEDVMLGTAALLAGSGLPPSAVAAFGSSKVPCSQRCSIGGVTGDIVHDLEDLLLSFGAQSTSVQEERAAGSKEQEIFADETWRAENRKLWDSCRVVATFDVEHDVQATLESVRDVMGLTSLQADIQDVLNEEWEAAVKASYVPTEIEPDLWIVPHWDEPPNPAATNIILEPGMAFGTGEHPTTRLCLGLVRQHVSAGNTVMDYGTGSGVLGIAALAFGAALAVGTDVDAFAVRVATSNAALNDCSDVFEVLVCGEDATDPDPVDQSPTAPAQYDMVVANILRGPLVDLRPRLLGYLRPGGRLILSGIIEEQVEQVLGAYSVDLDADSVEVRTQGSWAAITALRCSA
eukprot:jgi/Tetstr1/423261/TSEL_013961.t1